MARRRPSQFEELAISYDALNDHKDYRAEARLLEGIARRFGPEGRTRWLDVGCGTGRHLANLRARHPVVGVDGSEAMLRIARARLPGIRLVHADMRSFRLRSRFEVATCVYGPIGHLRTRADVAATFRTLAHHLAPGGVAIVEPWIHPAAFRPGALYLRTHEDASGTVVRLAFSARRGDRSILRYHFLVGRPRRGVEYHEVEDVGLLLSRQELLGSMRNAGLHARWIARGLTPGRGLLVGTKVEGEQPRRPGPPVPRARGGPGPR